ncbi:MAG: hypothetical protein OER96_02050 [Gammaproteobacteria bacterium]|nr:hypothetical protein [Gammaproteobacteria bacterium]
MNIIRRPVSSLVFVAVMAGSPVQAGVMPTNVEVESTIVTTIDFVQFDLVNQNAFPLFADNSILQPPHKLVLFENLKCSDSTADSAEPLILLPIPIPASIWLFSSAIIGLVVVRQKRQRTNAMK